MSRLTPLCRKRAGGRMAVAPDMGPPDGRPKLIVLCGPSHSGKTTFVERYCKGFRVISSDRIREQYGVGFPSIYEGLVWQTFQSQKCRALREGHNVVLDACHMSEIARWHALQGPNSQYKKICVVFDLPLETIRERCLASRRIPLAQCERMWRAFQYTKPTVQELRRLGFDKIYFVQEYRIPAGQPPWERRSNISSSVADGGCRRTLITPLIFHYLLAGLPIRPEGAWYNDKGVNYG